MDRRQLYPEIEPYATGTFGSVYSNSVVEHIPDPENVLPELARVNASHVLPFVDDWSAGRATGRPVTLASRNTV